MFWPRLDLKAMALARLEADLSGIEYVALAWPGLTLA
jgi:hypothetical protein